MATESGMDRVVSKLSDGVWPPAVLAAVASMPFSFVVRWYVPFLSSLPVFFAGVVVGYAYRQNSKRAIRVGTRMGLVGALPSVWVYVSRFDPVEKIGPGGPLWAVVAEVSPLLGLLVLVTVLSGLMGFTGTLTGVKTKHNRPSAEAT